MVIVPKIMNNVCLSAHPEGCAYGVQKQIDYVRETDKKNNFQRSEKPKNVLIIGSSLGYGLASRIVSCFHNGDATLGVAFERPSNRGRTATPGYYCDKALEKEVKKEGLYYKTILGDAFSDEIKKETLETIKKDLGKIDILIYSVASPKRIDPKDGQTYNSVLKPIGQDITAKTIDPFKGIVKEVSIQKATDEEIASTVKVMGGEDWSLWIEALKKENLLNDNFLTLAYSYIGDKLTQAVYRDGTIGAAKKDLEKTARNLDKDLNTIHGHAYVVMNKAVITRASSVIPIFPLYITLLFKEMKNRGLHEGCIEQMYRLFTQKLHPVKKDADELIRMDDWELKPEVQKAVVEKYFEVTQDNLKDYVDLNDFEEDFYQLHGFGFKNIDYKKDLEDF